MLPLHSKNKLSILEHLNIQTLKLAPLLAQYLYANKRLDLTGIGSFSLDAAINHDSETSKSTGDSINFKCNPYTKESAELIAYISAQTGKMKPLAAADLNSHIDLVQEFLNIGKPFLLEGIGSISKQRSGEVTFSGADLISDKLKDHSSKEVAATSATEESFSSTDSRGTFKIDWRKPAMIGMILIGTGLAIWGGYSIYKKSNNSASITANTEVLGTSLVVADTMSTKADSIPPAPELKPSGYKFILETAGKTRAFARYKTLKGYFWPVQMETIDSVKYKLFLMVPTSDTNWVMDSLTALNGRRVYIER